MAKKQIQDYSTAELRSRQKALSIITYIVISLLIAYAIVMFYQMINQTWDTRNPLISMPFLLFAVAVIIGRSIASINAELKRRETE